MPYEQFDDPLADPLIDQRALAARIRGGQFAAPENPFMPAPRPQMSMPGMAPAPAQAGPTLEQQRQELRARIDRRPDDTPLIEHAKQREEGSNRKLMLALTLGAMGGESFKDFAGMMGQQAMKEGTPYEIPGGWGTATSKGVLWNEQKQREADLGHLQAIEKMQQDEESKKAQRQLAADNAQRHNEVLISGQQNTAAIAAAALAAKQQGGEKLHLQRMGTTPSGETVTFNPSNGQQMVNGQPYNGPVMSQATLDKQAGAVQESLAGISRMKALDAVVAANPNAFGGVATLSSLAPTIFSSRIQLARLTPQEREARAQVLQESANIIHDLYGAALTIGEERRAASFAPNPTDPPEMILTKLRAATQWANSKASMYGSGVRGTAEARTGNRGGNSGSWAPPPGVSVQRIP